MPRDLKQGKVMGRHGEFSQCNRSPMDPHFPHLNMHFNKKGEGLILLAQTSTDIQVPVPSLESKWSCELRVSSTMFL